MIFRPAVLIGIYNHGSTIAGVVGPLVARSITCRIVDDGSDEATRAELEKLVRRWPAVVVEHLPENRGKGAALIHGFVSLARDGFTHAVVLDADGQHETNDVEVFVEAARRQPQALVVGRPLFDETAPKSRLYGRRLSQFWVHVETLSFAIADPLCGYRSYPLEATNRVLRECVPGLRMDFVPEIAVRLVWAGVPVVNVPTRVSYFSGGISHFHMIRDNARITWMHTRLVFGMLRRLPALLFLRQVRHVSSST